MKKLTILFLCLIGFGLCTTMLGFGQEKGEYVLPVDDVPPFPADVTFTIENTSYKTNNGIHWFAAPQFSDFSETIQEDLTKILEAKGFNVRGPYESYDLIPFQDKKTIDLLVSPTVELTVAVKDLKEKAANMWQAAADQTQSGEVEVSGRMLLQMKEIATQELMWAKTVPFKNFTFPYSVKVKYKEYAEIKKSGSRKLYSYDPVFAGMAKGVEEQYPAIMGAIGSLIDPEEMEIIKKQCQEIKSKKGY